MGGIWERYRFYADKRFSTLAGTLVYFLIMSVTPFLFWLAILAGNVDLSRFISHEIFSAVAPVIEYLQTSASGATGGASLLLILTSLWSSTNFFYHLRRSGEIIYETKAGRGGRLRFSALLAVLGAIILIGFAAAVPFLGYGVLEQIMPEVLAQTISTVFLIIFAFFSAYFLNVFACPYKLGFDRAAGGALLTLILWLICAVGFTIYLRFANPQRLYGAVAAVIVFLLWCYLMVNSLVIGIIYNGKYSGYIREYKLMQ